MAKTAVRKAAKAKAPAAAAVEAPKNNPATDVANAADGGGATAAPVKSGEKALPIAEQASAESNASAAAASGADAPAGGAPRETVQDPPTAAEAAGGDVQPNAAGDPAPVPAPTSTLGLTSALGQIVTLRNQLAIAYHGYADLVGELGTRRERAAQMDAYRASMIGDGQDGDALLHAARRVNHALFDAAGLPDGDDLVEICAKSRDGQAYRRAGFVWSGDFTTVLVTPEKAERLKADPHLVVKPEATA